MLPQLAGLLSCSMLAQSVDLLLQYTLPTAATLQHRKVRTRAIAPPRQVAAAAPSCDAAPNTSAHPSPPSPPLVAQAARVAKQKQFDPLQPFLPDWRSTLPKVPPSSYTVRAAAFSSAAYSMAQLPPPRWPEVAVVGRSNVGKSSLINYLLGSSSLAKVSKHPGKTQSINHYLVNHSWCLVDCPGYGYAKVSKTTRADWHAMTQHYFTSRTSLVDILLLVDASLPPRDMDLAGVEWLLQRHLPVTLVFTKVDKAKAKLAPPADNILAFREALEAAGLSVPPHFATSAAAKQGGRQLLQYLAQRRAQAAQQAAALGASQLPVGR